MIFCVFSFNRGQFLQNCISSIELCAPGSTIAIFDDNSTDEETVRVLDQYRERHRVIQPEDGLPTRHHLGGLYGNMQKAFEIFREEDLICFLQDDTQLIRPLTESTLSSIEEVFQSTPSLGFINPCFIRGINFTKGATYRFDEIIGLYFRDDVSSSSGVFFSALAIMKPSRLTAYEWAFQRSEPTNNHQASEKFMKMGYLYAPFAMWLPEVPAYRGKQKTLGLKLAEKKRQCGFHPFKQMTPEEVEKLESRDKSELPIAEAFLSCVGKEPPKPWAYNPLTDTGWMKNISQIELFFRRLFR